MKNLLAASFAALLLASALTANAASPTTAPAAGGVVAPATSVATNAGNGHSTATPALPAQGVAPIAAQIAPRRTNGINPWDVNLVTQTGYGR